MNPEEYLRQHRFLLEELIARDFKKKYKRTVLGIGWSVLSPLMMILVYWLVFSNLLGRDVPHYVIYIFSGQALFNYFTEATIDGMQALVSNSTIFTRVNVPKYLFVLSKNASAGINFLMVFLVFTLFSIGDGLYPTPLWLTLVYPIAALAVFNIGMGLVLSALFVLFRDIQYLYSIFIRMLIFLSAIFYTLDHFSPEAQRLFLINPLFVMIRYVRMVVIEGVFPPPLLHLLCLVHASAALAVGWAVYRHYDQRFLYYV